jgi:hypothetical protein
VVAVASLASAVTLTDEVWLVVLHGLTFVASKATMAIVVALTVSAISAEATVAVLNGMAEVLGEIHDGAAISSTVTVSTAVLA